MIYIICVAAVFMLGCLDELGPPTILIIDHIIVNCGGGGRKRPISILGRITLFTFPTFTFKSGTTFMQKKHTLFW